MVCLCGCLLPVSGIIDQKNLDKKIAVMIDFEYSYWFWAFPVIGLLVLWAIYLRYQKRKSLQSVFSEDNLKRLWPAANKKTDVIRAVFLFSSIIFLVVALANPRLPGKEVEVEQTGSDVIIALDISMSMLVRDVPPNRLSRAVRFSNDLIKSIPGERYGLVFFAGSAYTQMPLSQDARVASLFLQNADPSQASNQGTAIGDAVELATGMFDDTPGRGKAIIIISDGEDHDPNTMEKIKQAVEKRIYIITVGVGTTQGGTVPDRTFGQEGVIKDEEGRPVISRFDQEFLQQVAKESGGEFFTINDQRATNTKIKQIVDNMEKGTLNIQSYQDFESYFQYPLLLSLMMYLLYMIWPLKRVKIGVGNIRTEKS